MVWEIRWPGLDLPSCRCPSGRGELPRERFAEKILQSRGRGWVNSGLVPCFGVFEGWWYGSCGVRELGCMNYGSQHRQQETICAGKDKNKRFLQQTMWILCCQGLCSHLSPTGRLSPLSPCSMPQSLETSTAQRSCLELATGSRSGWMGERCQN